MGANLSVQTNKTISTVVNDTITESVAKMTNTVETLTSLEQNVIVNIYGGDIAGDIKVSQKGKIAVKILTKLDNSAMAEITNKIQTKLKQQVEQGSKQKNQGINLGQLNTSIQVQEMDTFVQNNVRNIVKTEIDNVITNRVSGKQQVSINLVDVNLGGDMVISQDALIKNIADNVAKNIISTVVDNKLITDIDQAGKQSSIMENIGVDPMALFGIIIAVVMLVVAAIVGKKMMSKR
jgi:hypothetical protein